MISVKINIIPLKKSSEIRSQASMQNSKNEKAQGLTAPQEKAESHDAEQRNEWEAERGPPLNGSTSPLASSWGVGDPAARSDAHRSSAQRYLQPCVPAGPAGKYPEHVSHCLKPHTQDWYTRWGELTQHSSASRIFKRLNAKKSPQRL